MATATPEPRSWNPGPRPDSDSSIPPLKDGDRLDAVEFERRYDAAPDVKKAELIEGVVHVASPVRAEQHGIPHAMVLGWLAWYTAATPLVKPADNSTVRLDDKNVFQPDALLFIDPNHGGRIILNDGYIEGAPELAVEIAASTTNIDLREKLDVYQRLGVREYIVWRVQDQAIDWFTIQNNEYILIAPAEDGITRSVVFPGLWLDAKALLAGNLARVLAVGGEGVQSHEHAQFVAKLGESKIPG